LAKIVKRTGTPFSVIGLILVNICYFFFAAILASRLKVDSTLFFTALLVFVAGQLLQKANNFVLSVNEKNSVFIFLDKLLFVLLLPSLLFSLLGLAQVILFDATTDYIIPDVANYPFLDFRIRTDVIYYVSFGITIFVNCVQLFAKFFTYRQARNGGGENYDES